MITLLGNPISTQNAYGQTGHRRYMKKEAKDTKDSYVWQAKSQWKKLPLTENDLCINIILYFKDNRRRDWDNWHKISCDALSGIVWEDDSQIKEAHVFMEHDKKNPRIEITIL